MQSRRFSGLPAIGILTVVYFIAGKFGLMLASLHASASPVWPAAGVALASLLVLGYRVWPAIFLGAFLVNISTPALVPTATALTAHYTLAGLLDTIAMNLSAATPVATSLGIAAGNTLEGLLGAFLVNRMANGRQAFDHPGTVFKFAVLAGVMSTTLSPTVGVTSLSLGR